MNLSAASTQLCCVQERVVLIVWYMLAQRNRGSVAVDGWGVFENQGQHSATILLCIQCVLSWFEC
jgi:hypothetical protein